MASEVASKSAIVVVVDRLGAGYLGSYGNTWIETPCLNQLAVESMLYEWAISDSLTLDRVYRSYWQGQHAACNAMPTEPKTLPAVLAERGIHTSLMSDEATVCSTSVASCFAEVAQLPTREFQTAASIDDTQLARSFAAAIEKLQSLSAPFLFWFHASGMSGPWDAPLELRQQFADEEDPTPPDVVRPPAMKLADDADPDDVLGMTHAYAGQVVVCDLCVGALLDVVSTMREDVMLVFTSPRGFPLGEHGQVGDADEALYGESLHVPWLVRTPNANRAAQRRHNFVQPADLFAMLCKWFGAPTQPLIEDVQRDRVCAVTDHEQAIRTPAWFMRQGEGRNDLFVKPDDRWEMNEVSDRCEDVVEELSARLNEFSQAAQANDFTSLSPLSEVLLDGLD